MKKYKWLFSHAKLSTLPNEKVIEKKEKEKRLRLCVLSLLPPSLSLPQKQPCPPKQHQHMMMMMGKRGETEEADQADQHVCHPLQSICPRLQDKTTGDKLKRSVLEERHTDKTATRVGEFSASLTYSWGCQ